MALRSPHFPALVCAAFVVLAVLWPITRRVLRAIAARRALTALARHHIALSPPHTDRHATQR